MIGHHLSRRGPGLAGLSLAAVLAVAPVSVGYAETFDCVIEPAVTVRVGSPVQGVLESVTVDRGDVVVEGQEIARLYSRVEEKTVALNEERAASMAEVEAQQARLTLSQSRLERTRSLFERDISTRDQLEEATAEMEVVKRELAIATMQHRVAGLELDRARELVEQRIIRSPISGVVVERSLFKGEFFDQTDEVATIAQLDPLHVEAYLPVEYFGRIAVGMRSNVMPSEPIGGLHEGTVIVVDQVFDAASNTFGVRVELENRTNRIPAGHRCTLEFPQLVN